MNLLHPEKGFPGRPEVLRACLRDFPAGRYAQMKHLALIL